MLSIQSAARFFSVDKAKPLAFGGGSLEEDERRVEGGSSKTQGLEDSPDAYGRAEDRSFSPN